ncbi:MAG: hypothetical protein CM15mP77_0150 [Synechococcus sp.]|nr:MAG: hypothetical protein CM15mP77_0150 [Synechococcus sp.]
MLRKVLIAGWILAVAVGRHGEPLPGQGPTAELLEGAGLRLSTRRTEKRFLMAIGSGKWSCTAVSVAGQLGCARDRRTADRGSALESGQCCPAPGGDYSLGRRNPGG